MYPDTERGDEAAESAGSTQTAQGVPVRCPPLPSSAASQQQHCPSNQPPSDLGMFHNYFKILLECKNLKIDILMESTFINELSYIGSIKEHKENLTTILLSITRKKGFY